VTGQTVSSAVAKREDVDKVVSWVEGASPKYASVLPSHLGVEHWVRLATGLLRRNEDLARIAIKNPQSFQSALLECARLGHEPGTDQFALVPFGDEVVGIEQYQGELERMYRAGGVASVVCQVVYEFDTFSYQPGQAPFHVADWFAGEATRGKLHGVYAYANLTGGGISQVVVMGAEEVGKHREVARTKTVWDKWKTSMWKKTAIHELAKWVPMSAEYIRERLRAQAEAEAEAAPVYKIEQVGEPAPEVDE
jgi:recombination protein RecT